MNLLLETLERKNSLFVSCKLQKSIPFKYELIIFCLVTPIKYCYHESYDGRNLINFGG